MPANKAALDFLEKCGSAGDAAAVQDMFFAEMAALGYAYIACCSHVDPLRPPRGAVCMINYPMVWLSRFSENNYALRDPIFLGARRAATPFFCSDLIRRQKLARDQKRILNEAASVGIADGMTIPIHWPGSFAASCWLVPGPDGVHPIDIPGALMMAIAAQDAARRRQDAPVHVSDGSPKG